MLVLWLFACAHAQVEARSTGLAASSVSSAHTGCLCRAAPLKWSARLSLDAQGWANACTFSHSGGGENLSECGGICVMQCQSDQTVCCKHPAAAVLSAGKCGSSQGSANADSLTTRLPLLTSTFCCCCRLFCSDGAGELPGSSGVVGRGGSVLGSRHGLQPGSGALHTIGLEKHHLGRMRVCQLPPGAIRCLQVRPPRERDWAVLMECPVSRGEGEGGASS